MEKNIEEHKRLLYRKINALRLEVDSSIIDDIQSEVDSLFASLSQPSPHLEGVEEKYTKLNLRQAILEGIALGLSEYYNINGRDFFINETLVELIKYIENEKQLPKP